MARDIYHSNVRNALVKDGWKITHDPYSLSDKNTNMDYQIDIGAQKLIVADKGLEKIAVEVKSFLKASFVHEFHGILGQYLIYIEGLKLIDPNRKLYLAMPDFAHRRLQDYSFLAAVINFYKINIIIYNVENESITSWIE
ncbi:MAG: hypothetical protein RIS64_1296 [Bacteroidota bacterium]|jgi:hypothetical protein